MDDRTVPKILKYSVVFLDYYGSLDSLLETPDSKWSKIETMAYDGEIDRIFEGFKKDLGREVSEMTKFKPRGVEGIVVYFDPNDKKSLLIVGADNESTSSYIQKLRLRMPTTLIPTRSSSRWRF